MLCKQYLTCFINVYRRVYAGCVNRGIGQLTGDDARSYLEWVETKHCLKSFSMNVQNEDDKQNATNRLPVLLIEKSALRCDNVYIAQMWCNTKQ